MHVEVAGRCRALLLGDIGSMSSLFRPTCRCRPSVAYLISAGGGGGGGQWHKMEKMENYPRVFPFSP